MNLPEGHLLQGEKYQLTAMIGQGGFGITYLGVWNTEVKGELGAMKTKVPVCIKEYFFKDYCFRDKETLEVKVHSQTGDRLFRKFKEKLILEAQILSEVHHPYIVNVLEVFEENNTAYIVMEYIRGCSLKYMLDKDGIVPENRALKYIHQIGNALAFVHDKNILHLDIKPSNILIDRENNARLIDFGVSKRYDIDEQETSTTTLSLSKGFAPIEQYDNEGTQSFSPCPDIYSLGATFYNIITGVVPIESILRAAKKLEPPSTYNSSLSPKTEQAILKAMEIKPADRFQTVKEMLAALDAPSYEFEETNNLTEEHSLKDPDDTEDIPSRHRRQSDAVSSFYTPDKEDNTEFNPRSGRSSRRKREAARRKRRRRLIIAAISMIAVAAFAVYDYSSAGKKLISGLINLKHTADTLMFVEDPEPLVFHNVENEEDTVAVRNTAETETGKQNIVIPPVLGGNSHGSTLATNGNTTKPAATQTNGATDSEAAEAAEKEYNQLLLSAQEKFDRQQYAEAKEDLLKANKIKPTEEVVNLIGKCNEESEKLAVAERIKKYEKYEKINYGAILTVVRDKNSGKFGAINDKAIELIRCKYKNVDKLASGLFFLRDDDKYDQYDDKGNCINEGLDADSLQ